MFSLPARGRSLARPTVAFFPSLFLILLFAVPTCGQGSGRASTGTGGNHMIQGKIFFPSGRRAEGTIQVKLTSLQSPEITAIADSSGSFTFSGLSPGNYTFIVNAGDQYEIAHESVTIDSDLNLSRAGVSLNSGPRRYTVMVTLQAKPDKNNVKPGVIKVGEQQKAIEDLKGAVSIYPKFPLALNELGVQYLKLGEAGKAVEPLKSAAKLSPDAFSPHLNLGIALLEVRQLVEAETELRAALKIASTPTAHMYLGLTLIGARRYDEAQNELETAISTGGENLAQAHRYLGGLYWQKHKYPQEV